MRSVDSPDVDARIASAPPQDIEPAAAKAHLLPDVLRDRLDVVFVGTAAGTISAIRGTYYANRGNSFWPALQQVGLIPLRFAKEDFRELPKFGIGLTDLSKTTCGADKRVAVTQKDLDDFDKKMRTCRPRVVAFTGKKPASLWLHRRTDRLRYGLQRTRAFECYDVFVLTSPSAAARRWWSLEPWHELADWLRAV
jgi:TDG/mug DNA glycosylase family protein